MSAVDVVGTGLGGEQVAVGCASYVSCPGLSRDRYTYVFERLSPGLVAMRLVRLSPQEAARNKRARRAMRLDASNYARKNVGLRGEVVIRPAPQGGPR